MKKIEILNEVKFNVIKKSLVTLALLAIVFLPVLSFANTDNSAEPITTTINNPLANKGINNIDGFIKVILTGVIKIGIPIVALAIIYSGFLFVSAMGNKEKLTIAKRSLMYSLIGAAILLGAWAIAQLISNTVLAL
ncbi:MAG: hypothetical protein WCX46_01790 [Candidatus Paceibacterota bacterium]